ncbi:MAG: pyridoxamine 5'-phosphate oxidase family protein [Propionibacteriales bacterium]|nr:pyridoxamine 5'-phosphate oxidase family protein [Propionibacteriales bacterium]
MQTQPAERRERPIVEMSVEECYARLSGTTVGRVAMATAEGLNIIPVNYIVDGRSVVVRTAPYTLLAAHKSGPIAFEVDDLDPDFERGWSVLMVGHASPMEDVDEMVALRAGERLRPWASGPRTLFITITPSRVTGRRII